MPRPGGGRRRCPGPAAVGGDARAQRRSATRRRCPGPAARSRLVRARGRGSALRRAGCYRLRRGLFLCGGRPAAAISRRLRLTMTAAWSRGALGGSSSAVEPLRPRQRCWREARSERDDAWHRRESPRSRDLTSSTVLRAPMQSTRQRIATAFVDPGRAGAGAMPRRCRAQSRAQSGGRRASRSEAAPGRRTRGGSVGVAGGCPARRTRTADADGGRGGVAEGCPTWRTAEAPSRNAERADGQSD